MECAELADDVLRYPLGRPCNCLEALADALLDVVPNNLDLFQHVVHLLLGALLLLQQPGLGLAKLSQVVVQKGLRRRHLFQLFPDKRMHALRHVVNVLLLVPAELLNAALHKLRHTRNLGLRHAPGAPVQTLEVRLALVFCVQTANILDSPV